MTASTPYRRKIPSAQSILVALKRRRRKASPPFRATRNSVKQPATDPSVGISA